MPKTKRTASATRFSPDLYARALRFAAAAHGCQQVPGSNLPYILHLCSVAAEVIAVLEREPPREPNLAVACALLHDVAEDTDVKTTAIRQSFGVRVARGVAALTKKLNLPKNRRTDDSLVRIRRQPREVWLVKLADRLVNLQPPPADWSPAKCRAYRREAKRILNALGSASPLLASRLRDRIEKYPYSQSRRSVGDHARELLDRPARQRNARPAVSPSIR
jgi:(p)ppGpp synthase/HD superfamily hydrolase